MTIYLTLVLVPVAIAILVWCYRQEGDVWCGYEEQKALVNAVRTSCTVDEDYAVVMQGRDTRGDV